MKYTLSDVRTFLSQIWRIGQPLDIDFVVSTGDNFYDDGLKGVNDPAFQESFTKIYTAQSLQKPKDGGKSKSPNGKLLIWIQFSYMIFVCSCGKSWL